MITYKFEIQKCGQILCTHNSCRVTYIYFDKYTSTQMYACVTMWHFISVQLYHVRFAKASDCGKQNAIANNKTQHIKNKKHKGLYFPSFVCVCIMLRRIIILLYMYSVTSLSDYLCNKTTSL